MPPVEQVLTAGDGRWTLSTLLAGENLRGRYRAVDRQDQSPGVAWISTPQTVPLDGISQSLILPGLPFPEISFVGWVDRSHEHCVLIEREPLGSSLRELGSALSGQQKEGVARGLGRFVARCHDMGLVLGFLRPEYIYLQADSSGSLVLTGVLRGELFWRTAGRLLEGLFPYSPPDCFSPPEVIRNTGATALSDVFSLSAIAYWLLTDRHPFRGETAFDNVVAALTGDRTDPVPGVVIPDVIDRGLSPDPAGRPTLVEWLKGLGEA